MSFGGGGALVLSRGGDVKSRVQAQGGALVAPVNSLTKRVTALEESLSNMQTILANIRKVIVKGNQTDAKIQEELAKQQNLLFQDKIRKNREAELEETRKQQNAEIEAEVEDYIANDIEEVAGPAPAFNVDNIVSDMTENAAAKIQGAGDTVVTTCLLYTSPSPRD